MRAQTRRWIAPLVVVALPACSSHSPPDFTVDPPMACPGQVVQVRWDVAGKAILRAERGSGDWDEQEVSSSGRRIVAPAVTTTFKLTPSDVNPAKGLSMGSKTVEVPRLDDERRVDSRCDAATRTCSAQFVLDNPVAQLQVRRLSSPRLIQAGHAQDFEVCVTHEGLHECVGAKQAIDVHATANGTWKLEAKMPADMKMTPQPALVIHLDFACS